METVRFNADELREIQKECSLFSELVAKLERQYEASGKVICSITLNGMRLTEADEGKFSSEALEAINTLEVEIETTANLVSQTIVTIRDGLVGLQTRTIRVADLVRENPAGDAQLEFCGLMENTSYLTQALGALKPRARMDQQGGALWHKAEVATQRMLKELLEAFSGQDFVLVADVLEYELSNLLAQWIEVIDYCDFD